MTSVCLCVQSLWRVFQSLSVDVRADEKPLWGHSARIGGKALPPPPSFASLLHLPFIFPPLFPRYLLLTAAPLLLLFPCPISPKHPAHSFSGASSPAIAVFLPALICICSFLCPPSFFFFLSIHSWALSFPYVSSKGHCPQHDDKEIFPENGDYRGGNLIPCNSNTVFQVQKILHTFKLYSWCS